MRQLHQTMFTSSTSFNVLAAIKSGMPSSSADPLTLVRRERLQDFCRRKGWQHADGRWNTGEASKFFGKPTQKMSDLLGGRGSFGSKIARELEEATAGEVPRGYLDDLVSDHKADFVLRDGKGFETHIEFKVQELSSLGVRWGSNSSAKSSFMTVLPAFAEQAKKEVTPAKRKLLSQLVSSVFEDGDADDTVNAIDALTQQLNPTPEQEAAARNRALIAVREQLFCESFYAVIEELKGRWSQHDRDLIEEFTALIEKRVDKIESIARGTHKR